MRGVGDYDLSCWYAQVWHIQEGLFGGVGRDALVDFYRVALHLFGLF